MNKKSFTLIELLVVIAIIGILSSLVIARFSDWGDNARIANTLQWSAGVHRKLGANLVGHWEFNEGSGTIARDLSGYDNYGTLEGPLWANEIPGTDGYALEFDGINDYVDIPDDISLRTTSDWTRVIWVKSTTPSEGDGDLHDAWSQRITTNKFLIRVHATGSWIFYYKSTGGGFSSAQIPRSSNTFQHLVVAKSGADISFYLNGEQTVDANNAEDFSNDSHRISLGSHFGGDRPFPGIIDDVRIYNTALTAQEVSRIYAETKDKYLVYE